MGVFVMLINWWINHNSALLITLREAKMLHLNSSGIPDGWCVMMWWQFCALTLATLQAFCNLKQLSHLQVGGLGNLPLVSL